MIHKPIQIKDLSVSFPHKTCFDNFNCHILYGQCIAIVGRNGSGKSTLLNMLAKITEPSTGSINMGTDVVIGHVPQIVENHLTLSGGQRLSVALDEALSLEPNILLLDEPTNHLDRAGRERLFQMLLSYKGTLIVVSHDTELLRKCIDTMWHIDSEKIHIFSGKYDNYLHEITLKRAAIENNLEQLNRQKKDMHDRLRLEQQRAAKSRSKGEKNQANRKWIKMTADLKAMKAEKSQGKKLRDIDAAKEDLSHKLMDLHVPEIILPKFFIKNDDVKHRVLIQISDGSIGYIPDQPLISNIRFTVCSKDRIAILGDNGSGKSTLIKAILEDEAICKTGEWFLPKQHDIGYLEQHYNTLPLNDSVIESVSTLVPDWTNNEIRRHLNNFLFRKNEEVNSKIGTLSGGEKARLVLARIAAKPPKLLILDEITNNFDLEAKAHVAQVLKNYPGAMIIISHEIDFLAKVGIDGYCHIDNGRLSFDA